MPRSIVILGQRVKIKVVNRLGCSEDDELDGAFDASTMTIYISKRSDMQSTLLHEAIHSCLAISGTSNLLTNKAEEAITSALEAGLKPYFKF